MSIKAGELLHVGNQVVLDRVQTAGGALNIPIEKIYELGNYQTVGQVRDIPDLTFNLESIDASAELEALLTNNDFATDAAGTEYVISNWLPMDVAGQFKAGRSAAAGGGEEFEIIGGVAVPYLALESLSYRFGLRDNAGQTATLRGDGLFYGTGGVVIQEVAGAGTANQDIILSTDGGVTDDDAVKEYNGDLVNGTRYALSVTLVNEGKRLSVGNDFTEAVDAPLAGNVTLTVLEAVAVTETIRIVYLTDNATPLTYAQAVHAAQSATRPAAVKGKDIEIRVGGVALTDRWSSVQSVQVDYRVNLERDEEMGNSQIVDQDYDVPEVTGTVQIKPRDFAEFMERIHQISNVPSGEVVGPNTSQALSMDVIIHSPEDGSVLKTLHVPDARFTLPGYTGRVQQKQTFDLAFDSDSGQLSAFKGARP